MIFAVSERVAVAVGSNVPVSRPETMPKVTQKNIISP
jgi:hypothetical protein